MTTDLPWVSWARSLLPDHPDRWEAWRCRADAHLGTMPLEAALDAAWREMAGEASRGRPDRSRAVYAVVDLETGGTDPQTCAICSVAVMTLDEELNEVARYHRLVADEPGKDYWPRSMAVNGLDAFRLRRMGTPVARVIRDLSRGLEGRKVVGHNIAFDLRFLAERGVEASDPICTLELSRAALPEGSHKLGDVADRLGVLKGKAHDAMGDVETTANVFRALSRMAETTEEQHR